MSRIAWLIGGGVVGAYLWKHATKPQLTKPHTTLPFTVSVVSPRDATAAPRNARRKKDHPDLVSVVAHARAWPGTSLQAR